jgi:filamentous hemagglutinin family protein
MQLLYPCSWIAGALCLPALLLTTYTAQAQVIPDNTTPTDTGACGAICIITGGTARGANLFHSFQDFNVNQGQAVRFVNPDGIANILSRVTGANPSNIRGILGVNGAANLFLLNPNGIVFGPNAQLDLRGSFLATTANSFVFPDGSEFSATNPQAPPLLAINVPIGLQYGGRQPGAIQVQDSALIVDEGRSLVLVGGDVNLNNSFLAVDFSEGGRIELGAIAGEGTVGLNATDNLWSLNIPDAIARADVSLTNGSRLDVSAANGGSIAIQARNIEILQESELVAGIASGLGSPTSQAGDIVLNATEVIQIQDRFSLIRNLVFQDAIGNSGDINITTGSLKVTGGAQLQAITYGRGNAGNVIINARDRVLFDGTSTDGRFFSAAFSTVETGAVGSGGNVEISTGSLVVRNGAQLQAQTEGQGDAGNVIINARDRVLFDDSDAFSTVEPGGVGSGGNIQITTGILEVFNGATLQASTFGQGNAGNVIIVARDGVVFDNGGAFSRVGAVEEEEAVRSGGNIVIDVETGSLIVRNGAQLQAFTRGRGDAGDVIIAARDRVEVLNNAQLQAQTEGQGNAGDVIISAGDHVLFDDSDAFSTVEPGGVGSGGNIQITTGILKVLNNATLQANTFRQGDAGNVIINASDRVLFDNSNAFTTLEPRGVGSGGDIRISTGSLAVRNGAQLQAQTYGQGDAGNVMITAGDRVEVLNNAQLQAQTEGQGNAGDVIISAGDRVLFDDSDAFSTVEPGGVGSGGNIQITTGILEVFNGATLQASTFGQGNAGNVIIVARDGVVFDNGGAFSRVGAVEEEEAVRSGGNIVIDVETGSLIVRNGAQLQAFTRGRGDAGDVIIAARDRVEVLNNAQLQAQTEGQGNAGDVIISAGDHVLFDDSDAFSTVEPGGVGSGGNIQITTGILKVLNNATLQANTFRQGDAGNVIINASDRVLFDNSNAFTTLEPRGVGSGGDIRISTGSLAVRNGAQLQAQTYGQGDAGNVMITAGDRVVFNNSNAFSTVEPRGVGSGGNIRISTGSLAVRNGAQLQAQTYGEGNAGNVIIDAGDDVRFDGTSADGRFASAAFSSVEPGGVGRGGDVIILAKDSLTVRNGARLFAATRGQGTAGNVFIDAGNRVLFDGTSADGQFASAAFASVQPEGENNAGTIRINTNSLIVRDGAQLFAATRGRGTAGNVFIDTSDRVLFDNGDAFSRVGRNGVGNAGTIRINTGSLTIRNGAQLFANTRGQGTAGDVFIDASDSITLDGTGSGGDSSAIFASTAASATERGGTITIKTPSFQISNGAIVNARTANGRRGGDITINATDTLEVINGQVTATTVDRGNAGSITIRAGTVRLQEETAITVNSQGNGEGGSITFNTNELTLDNGSSISAATASTDGGNIALDVGEILLLHNGSNISTNAGEAGGTGDGGNIRIANQNGFILAVPIENSDIVANADRGDGGRIGITTQGIFGLEFRLEPTDLSDITANSSFGVDGEVVINTPDVDPSRGLIELPVNLVDASQQITQACPGGGAIAAEELGSFVVTGRGGLSPNPMDLVTDGTARVPLVTLEEGREMGSGGNGEMGSGGNGGIGEQEIPPTSPPPHLPISPPIEAQTWVQGADGKVMLVSHAPGATPQTPTLTPAACPTP